MLSACDFTFYTYSLGLRLGSYSRPNLLDSSVMLEGIVFVRLYVSVATGESKSIMASKSY